MHFEWDGPARTHGQRTGYIGNTFGPKGFSTRSNTRVSRIEVSQIIIHKADEPDVVVNFFDADGLAGKDRAEVNLFVPQADPPAIDDLPILHDEIDLPYCFDVIQRICGRGDNVRS